MRLFHVLAILRNLQLCYLLNEVTFDLILFLAPLIVRLFNLNGIRRPDELELIRLLFIQVSYNFPHLELLLMIPH